MQIWCGVAYGGAALALVLGDLEGRRLRHKVRHHQLSGAPGLGSRHTILQVVHTCAQGLSRECPLANTIP